MKSRATLPAKAAIRTTEKERDNMNVTIDRFEGEYAVVEIDDGSFANLPLALVPTGADEGSVVSITLDSTATDKRQEKINNLMDKLFED